MQHPLRRTARSPGNIFPLEGIRNRHLVSRAKKVAGGSFNEDSSHKLCVQWFLVSGSLALSADAHHIAQLRRHGRFESPGGAGPGHQWGSLRDDRRRSPRLWHGLQNHANRHADEAAHFQKRGRLLSLRRAGPSYQWGPIRDNGGWHSPRLWHGLQNHPKWQADDAAPVQRPGGRQSIRRAGPGRSG
jgi:hypothetical protein